MGWPRVTGLALGIMVAVIAGCLGPQNAGQTPQNPGLAPQMVIDTTPQSLVEPGALDWATQRVSSKRIVARRNDYIKRTLQAFPTASTSWSGGISLNTSYGCTTTDFVPNGPAAAYSTDSASALYNKLFFLTKEGQFIKVDRATPTTFTRLNLGGSYTRTSISLSPLSSRAYVLNDAGTCTIINTVSMTSVGTISLGAGGFGIAPWIDPFASSFDDKKEVLYLAVNDGNVNKYTVIGTSSGSVTSVSTATTYAVATTVTPLTGSNKIAAPSVVLGGVIYVGDMSGYLRAYDTNDTANNLSYYVGGPVTTAPALEIQDGTYTLTDPLGNPKTVADNVPVYAFVNGGGACAWLNLHDASTTFSQQLRIDDNDSSKKKGFLLDYGYSTGGTTLYLAAEDGVNLNTESPDYGLPGTGANTSLVDPGPADDVIWSNSYLVPAETNTREDGSGNAAGGTIPTFIRWRSTAASPGPGSVINSATLTLSPAFDQPCRVASVRKTEPYYLGTTTPWVSTDMTNANVPVRSAANVGTYLSGGINSSGNVSYKDNKSYVWDVSSAWGAPNADGRYALALNYTPGDTVLWPEGPVGGGEGKHAKKATQIESVKFLNNALNANPAAGTSNDTRPLLTLQIATATLPSASIETAPLIDSVNHKIYVFYTNTLYEIDFSTPSAFADADFDFTTGVGTKHTIYNLTYYGNTSNSGGAAFNGNAQYVGNYSTPVSNFDMTAMYMLNRYPNADQATPVAYNYALSKITLPLSATVDKLVASSPTFTSIAGTKAYNGTGKEASTYLAIDPFPGVSNVYFGLGNGKVYQYDK